MHSKLGLALNCRVQTHQ